MEEAPRGPAVGPIAPFFVVRDLARALEFYGRLGFDARVTAPADAPFFAIVGRDGAQILLKAVADDVEPQPNPSRHPWAAWDAFVHARDPDALAREFTARGVPLHAPVSNRDDGLRGFEIRDTDGYVLFFGHPADR